MRICRFYQQGTCKFGNNCKFLHEDYNNNYGQSVLRSNNYRDDIYGYSNVQNYESGSTGISRQNYRTNNTEYYDTQNYGRNSNAFSSRQGYNLYNVPSETSVKPESQSRELMQAVQQELKSTEKGGQWLLSCFAPFKEKACIPGFEDYSPEEIRWMMYQASQVGAVEECKQQIQTLKDSAQLKRQRIMNPDAEMYSVINNVYEGRVTDPTRQNSLIDTFSFVLPQSEVSPNLGVSNRPNLIETFSFSQSNNNLGNNLSLQNSNSVNVFGENTLQNQNMFGNSNPFGDNPLGLTDAILNNVFQEIQPQTISSINSSINAASASLPSASYLYSAVSECTDDERDQFLNSSFTLGKIPTKPPPKELCF